MDNEQVLKVLNEIERQLKDNLVHCVYEISMICQHAKYPEDLEDIYDVLVKYGINFKEIGKEQ